MPDEYRLLIDGDDVGFTIGTSGQAMAVPSAGKTDAGRPCLGATALDHGRTVWTGMISSDIDPFKAIPDQYSDVDLERLYRDARTRG